MKFHRSVNVLVAVAVAVSLTACARARIKEGYVVEEGMVAAVQPGVDNKDSVTAMLGPPSFDSQFDGGNRWYYVSRDLRQLAFRTPKPEDQDLIRVTFNSAGTVVAVDEQKGLDKVARIDPEGDRTPTIDGEEGFFSDLFDGVGGTQSQRTAGSSDPTRPD